MTLMFLTILVILVGMVIYTQMRIVTKEENDYPDSFWEDEKTGEPWTMHTLHYTNRYKELVYFVQVGPNKIQMTFESEHYRIGYENNGDGTITIDMVDPPGGPMVMVGMDMGRFYEVWKDCIVSEIEQEQRIFYITFIKTKQND